MDIKKLVFVAAIMFSPQAFSQTESDRQNISWVDTSLSDAEKFVLKVDGKPYYMTSVQFRADKLKRMEGWNNEQIYNLFQQLVADNFNTVSIPLPWFRVEPTKNVFDWSVLDFYLKMVEEAGLKMELLWFGSNTCGSVWTEQPPQMLRVPEYVVKDYKTIPESSEYTLDIADTALLHRETYILSQIMEHIAQWDETHGNKHTIIGVQINNEPCGKNGYQFSPMEMMRYQSDLAKAVKDSRYVTWTRVNATTHEYQDYINANETLRETEGTNIDFVGGDAYGKTAKQLSSFMPNKGKNYKMIMECGAEENNSQLYPFAALTTNTALSYYEYAGPDNHGLYDLTSTKGVVKVHNENTLNLIRTQNKLFNSAMQDIATKAVGKSMKIHNATGSDPSTTKGILGTTLDPLSPTQAISIKRSDTELVLLTVQKGNWNIPESLNATSASKGHFDENNEWVEEETIKFDGTFIPRAEASVIRVVLDPESAGINNAKDVTFVAEQQPVYDMQGRLVDRKSLKRGIYICGGKKQLFNNIKK